MMEGEMVKESLANRLGDNDDYEIKLPQVTNQVYNDVGRSRILETNDVGNGVGTTFIGEKHTSGKKRLCIRDENGKMFFLHIDPDEADQLFGLKVGQSEIIANQKSTTTTTTTTTTSEGRKRRRSRRERVVPHIKTEPETEEEDGFAASDEKRDRSTPEMIADVEGFDPMTGEVRGPEGQPIGPGNGSVVIREINSEKEINQAWFTTKEDKSALSEKGLNWKQGTWSSEEVALLNSNIFDYCYRRGIEDPVEIIFDMSKDERKDFYRCVSRGLQRPLFSVYRRVIRMYDAKNHIGKYTDEEVDKLRCLRDELGTDWAKIGAAMGRSAASVKDRCRLLKEDCKSGKWEEDEEERLINAVHSVTETKMATSVTSNVPWSQVADIVNTRSEKQCRTKWLNYLNWKQAGGNRNWGRGDELLLVTKMASLGDAEDSTVDWISMADGWSAVRSPQWLRNKWLALKRTLPQYQILTLGEACKMLLEDVSRCSATASRLLRPSDLVGGGGGGGVVGVCASRSASSLLGNDFWGVGEDSNGAASTSDIINGMTTESIMPSSLDAAPGSSSLIRPPTFSIHSDLGSHLLIDGSSLHLPAGTTSLMSGGVGVDVGGGETFHLAALGGHASEGVDVPFQLSSVADLPPTNAFPAFASVCINSVVGDDAIECGVRSQLTSPARDSPISHRDIILTADRDSRSPFPICDEDGGGGRGRGTATAASAVSAAYSATAASAASAAYSVTAASAASAPLPRHSPLPNSSSSSSSSHDVIEEDTFVITPSGYLIPFSNSNSIGQTVVAGSDDVEWNAGHPTIFSASQRLIDDSPEKQPTTFSFPQQQHHQPVISSSSSFPQQQHHQPVISSSSSSSSNSKQRSHLVVADELANGELISDVAVLEGTEYEVECVEDGYVEIGNSAFISDSNFLVVDAGFASTHDDEDDDDDKDVDDHLSVGNADTNPF